MNNLPFNFNDYDFICAGGGVELHQPYDEILAAIRVPRYGSDLKLPISERPKQAPPESGEEGKAPMGHHKIVFGADSKKAVVFVTYSGYDLGPKEAEPSLELLALEIEHLEFECIGRFRCPGRFLNEPTPNTYHGDIRDRPNERDLLKAQMFIEDTLEQLADITV